jgi:regulator of protease activity HflC (stomatin/prohibitin superfamily)
MDYLLPTLLCLGFFFFLFVLWIIFTGIRIVNQYQIGIILRLGKIYKTATPGLHIIIPFLDKIILIDTRTITLPIQSQKIITKDNVSIDVAGVSYYKIVDPLKSFTQIANAPAAVDQIAQTTVRETIGRFMLDEVLSKTDQINSEIRNMLDQHTETWGIQVSIVQLKDIELPESPRGSGLAVDNVIEKVCYVLGCKRSDLQVFIKEGGKKKILKY